MSAACPFCGDEREPIHHKEKPDDGLRPEYIHTYCCQCCGAQGALSSSQEGAMTLWNNREAPGSSEPWRIQFGKIT